MSLTRSRRSRGSVSPNYREGDVFERRETFYEQPAKSLEKSTRLMRTTIEQASKKRNSLIASQRDSRLVDLQQNNPEGRFVETAYVSGYQTIVNGQPAIQTDGHKLATTTGSEHLQKTIAISEQTPFHLQPHMGATNQPIVRPALQTSTPKNQVMMQDRPIMSQNVQYINNQPQNIVYSSQQIRPSIQRVVYPQYHENRVFMQSHPQQLNSQMTVTQIPLGVNQVYRPVAQAPEGTYYAQQTVNQKQQIVQNQPNQNIQYYTLPQFPGQVFYQIVSGPSKSNKIYSAQELAELQTLNAENDKMKEEIKSYSFREEYGVTDEVVTKKYYKEGREVLALSEQDQQIRKLTHQIKANEATLVAQRQLLADLEASLTKIQSIDASIYQQLKAVPCRQKQLLSRVKSEVLKGAPKETVLAILKQILSQPNA